MSLAVQDISFNYSQDLRILNSISFNVRPGKTFCVLGASGSGKTTLLRIIAGILPNEKSNSFSGSVYFNGSSIEELKSNGLLSFMYQEPALMPNLTVKGNVEFPMRMVGNQISDSIENTINIVGLLKSINLYPHELSGGMKSRTALARSFITEPKLLLLDEPFSSLDLGWQRTLYFELKTLQKRDNTSIVIVTHSVDEALELADDILILSHKGEILRVFNNSDSSKVNVANEAKKTILEDHESYFGQVL